MNISYDIFELMDFPLAVTDGGFNIVYKNRSAKRYLGKLRKGSKITKYMSCQSGDIDLTSIKETEFDTGTPIKRALVFCSRGAFVFTFMPCMQFEGYRQISEYIRENFPGDILDFFISSYAESRYPEFKCANVPSRVYADLLKLMQSFDRQTGLTEVHKCDITYIADTVSKNIGASFCALGMKMPPAEIDANVPCPCICDVNADFFLFILFRLIYAAFRLSDDGGASMSLSSMENGYVALSLSAHTRISPEAMSGGLISLIRLIPEFIFEYDLIEKYGGLSHPVSVEVRNSVLKISMRLKCEASPSLGVRAYAAKQNSVISRKLRTFISKLAKSFTP